MVIQIFQPLLEKEDGQSALLGVSSLIHNYCKTDALCGESTEIQTVLRTIETKLGTACRSVTEEDKVKILVVLKALGNAGRWVNAGSILKRCYAEENPMEIRVAALETFRSAPCDYDREHLLSVFRDTELDSELRIASYLAMMSCPTKQLIDTLKDHLTSEGVNQVGSFVWTHLTNLQESAAPEKQWVRHLIGEELLQNKFTTEALKFSRYYESSFYMNTTKVGATAESNVIFSSKSFLPRSAMLNLTVDLFGETLNLLEVGGRIEGFEGFIERFFGPNGYYPDETISEVIKNLRQDKPRPETTLEDFLETATDLPEASYYYKVLGSQMHFEHRKGSEIFSSEKKSSGFFDMIMEMARKGKVNYSKSQQLLDTTLTYPTISGLPIVLQVNSTATIGMQMDGNLRAKNMKNINIEGHIHPSAAINLDATMTIDAFVTKTGMKMASTLHTSTFLDGKIIVEGGRLVDIAFNMPKDKMEIVNFKNDFFKLDDNQVVLQTEQINENHLCSTKLSRALGLTMCFKTITPSNKFVGPYAASLTLEKEDTHSGYLFKYSHTPSGLSVMFDTPGSKVDRKWNLNIDGNMKSLNVEVITPFKTAKGSGSLDMKKNNHIFKGDLLVDASDEYNVKYESKSLGERDVWEVEKHLVIATPQREFLNMYGKILSNSPQMKHIADFTLSGPISSPITFHGKFM